MTPATLWSPLFAAIYDFAFRYWRNSFGKILIDVFAVWLRLREIISPVCQLDFFSLRLG